MPLRSFVAGFFTTTNFANPRGSLAGTSSVNKTFAMFHSARDYDARLCASDFLTAIVASTTMRAAKGVAVIGVTRMTDATITMRRRGWMATPRVFRQRRLEEVKRERLAEGAASCMNVDADFAIMRFNLRARSHHEAVAKPAARPAKGGTQGREPASSGWTDEQDERKWWRADVEAPVELRAGETLNGGCIENICFGGLFVGTQHIARMGDRLNLRFRLPGIRRRLAVEALVRWIRVGSRSKRKRSESGMGLEFVELSVEATEAIKSFLRRRSCLGAEIRTTG